MRVFSTQAALAATLANAGTTVGFVPTMGALHEGHLSLVRCSKRDNGVTVVSIFVNPNQFNDTNDLKNYPRDLDTDLKLLEAEGVDYVYAPPVEDVYPEPDTRVFEFGQVDKVMEGAFRPGHFNGVAQVVSRLFEIVKPDRAYFGEKDFQQLAVIRELVKLMRMTVDVIGCPIIREADGLARSSRNTLLTPEHRAAAPLIYQGLREASENAGKQTVAEVAQEIIRKVNENPLLKTEYVEIVDASTLQKVSEWTPGPRRGCIAVRAGNVRLIDNIDMTPQKK